MPKSQIIFNRWSHIQFHSWPLMVFKSYNEELSSHLWIDEIHFETFKKNINQYNDSDKLSGIFVIPKFSRNHITIGEFKALQKEKNNWIHLNCVMAMSANFETYLQSVISLAIESNPGILIGASKAIDGVVLLKNGSLNKDSYRQKLVKCTEGSWKNRIDSFERLFGTVPTLLQSNIVELDRIRNIRNKIGHAFGRDIDASRAFDKKTTLISETVSIGRVKKWLRLFYDIAFEVDEYLLDNHIGEFQAILAYHKNFDTYKNLFLKERINLFKQEYGKIDQQIGKVFCKGLIEYYDSI